MRLIAVHEWTNPCYSTRSILGSLAKVAKLYMLASFSHFITPVHVNRDCLLLFLPFCCLLCHI